MNADLETLSLLADLAAQRAPLPAPKGADNFAKALAKAAIFEFNARLRLAILGAVKPIPMADAYAILGAKDSAAANAALIPLEAFAATPAGSRQNPAWAVKRYEVGVRKSDGAPVWWAREEVAIFWVGSFHRTAGARRAAEVDAQERADAEATRRARASRACDFGGAVHLAPFEPSDLGKIPAPLEVAPAV